jgi:hypothetical protein
VAAGGNYNFVNLLLACLSPIFIAIAPDRGPNVACAIRLAANPLALFA